MEEEKRIEDKESVKLMRSVSGKVGWELKLREENIDSNTLNRLEELNNQCKVKFDN